MWVKEIGMKTTTIIVAVTTSVATGAEQDHNGKWYTRGSRYDQWVEEKIHSIHDHPKKARQIISRLTPVEYTKLADPSDPHSPIGFHERTTYCIRELCEGKDWPRGDAR